jgi:hypothetical protein
MRESLLPPALEQCKRSDGIVEQSAVRGAGNIIAGIVLDGPDFHFHDRGGRRRGRRRASVGVEVVGDPEPIAEAPRDGDVGGGRNAKTGMEGEQGISGIVLSQARHIKRRGIRLRLRLRRRRRSRSPVFLLLQLRDSRGSEALRKLREQEEEKGRGFSNLRKCPSKFPSLFRNSAFCKSEQNRLQTTEYGIRNTE